MVRITVGVEYMICVVVQEGKNFNLGTVLFAAGFMVMTALDAVSE